MWRSASLWQEAGAWVCQPLCRLQRRNQVVQLLDDPAGPVGDMDDRA